LHPPKGETGEVSVIDSFGEWSKEQAWSEGLLWRKLVYWPVWLLRGNGTEGSNKFIIKVLYSYILKSFKDNRYYYGSTINLSNRLIKHNKGDVKSTKNRRPLELHFFEVHNTRSEAFKREMFYKSIEGYHYLRQNGII
jgi:putative endonuclease